MVVILQDAATVFWVEYRRYVRTRRYWVLALTALAVSTLLCAGLAGLWAWLPSWMISAFGFAPYLPAFMVGVFLVLLSMVHSPLSSRMVQDVYKTRPLTDLYLTELHPLGVVLGRVAATTALMGLMLLMMTPAGLWLLHLIGAPLWGWAVIALLAGVGYLFGSSLDALAWRVVYLNEERMTPNLGTLFAAGSWLPAGQLAGFALSAFVSLLPLLTPLAQLPLFALLPPTAPFLFFAGVQGHGWLPALLGALFALGFAFWLAVAAAQWRDWWSDTAYRLQRWGGTAFWLVFVSVHTAYLAQAFVVDGASAERTLLLTLLIVCLANTFLIAPLTGYFGVARRPKPLRFALPYPWGGLVWQWALHWLAASTLYLAVGFVSGVWVAPTKWLFWATYFWAAFVLLPQAMSAAVWAYFQRYPTPLQGDHAHDYLLNTRGMRASLDALSQKSGSGAFWLAGSLAFAFSVQLLLNLANRAFPNPALVMAADWISRVHPWYGVYLEWLGGGGWAYLPYALAWAILVGLVNGRKGLHYAHMALQELQQWREQRESEPAPEETPKSVA